MKPSHQVKSWANDTIADGSGGPSVQDLENALNGNNESPVDKSNIEVVNTVEDASDDEYNDFKELSNKHGENEDEEEEEEMMSLGDLPTNEENKDKMNLVKILLLMKTYLTWSGLNLGVLVLKKMVKCQKLYPK